MEDIKKIAEAFAKKAKTEQEFRFNNTLFISTRVVSPDGNNKAELIYGIRLWDKKYPSKNDTPELCAIVGCDGITYLINPFLIFDAFPNEDNYCDACKPYSAFKKECHKKVVDVSLRLYEALEVSYNDALAAGERSIAIVDDGEDRDKIIKEYTERTIDQLAWEMALDPDKKNDGPVFNELNNESIYNIVLGQEDLEETVAQTFKKTENAFKCYKSLRIEAAKRIDKYQNSPEIVLYRAIKDEDAKYVTAVFEKNGNRAEGKIKPSAIRNAIEKHDDIDVWSFATRKAGENIYKALGTTGQLWKDSDDALYPTDIVEVKYNGKILYSKDTNSI